MLQIQSRLRTALFVWQFFRDREKLYLKCTGSRMRQDYTNYKKEKERERR